jgi:hypothetical protein
MNSIDIRVAQPSPFSSIVFGDGTHIAKGGAVFDMVNELEAGHDGFCYLNERKGDTVRVAYSDIDNLILALKKSKEVWAK